VSYMSCPTALSYSAPKASGRVTHTATHRNVASLDICRTRGLSSPKLKELVQKN
jgi:hypothetical protein